MPTLGTHMKRRRDELSIGQSAAARMASVARTSWINWEKGAAEPEEFNWSRIERVLQWERGSVAAILAGKGPTEISDTTVVKLSHQIVSKAPEDADPVIEEIRRERGLTREAREMLIEMYLDDKRREAERRERDDEDRRQRFRRLAGEIKRAAGE